MVVSCLADVGGKLYLRSLPLPPFEKEQQLGGQRVVGPFIPIVVDFQMTAELLYSYTIRINSPNKKTPPLFDIALIVVNVELLDSTTPL